MIRVLPLLHHKIHGSLVSRRLILAEDILHLLVESLILIHLVVDLPGQDRGCTHLLYWERVSCLGLLLLKVLTLVLVLTRLSDVLHVLGIVHALVGLGILLVVVKHSDSYLVILASPGTHLLLHYVCDSYRIAGLLHLLLHLEQWLLFRVRLFAGTSGVVVIVTLLERNNHRAGTALILRAFPVA